jgi:TRAP-type C4-dicarboxylate transport system permease large subunit
LGVARVREQGTGRSILGGVFTPTEASAVAAAYAFLLGTLASAA